MWLKQVFAGKIDRKLRNLSTDWNSEQLRERFGWITLVMGFLNITNLVWLWGEIWLANVLLVASHCCVWYVLGMLSFWVERELDMKVYHESLKRSYGP